MKLGIKEEAKVDVWLRIMPELIVHGVKFISDCIDQEIGEAAQRGSVADRFSASMATDGGFEEAVVMYDVPPHLKEAGVQDIFTATKAAESRRVQGMS